MKINPISRLYDDIGRILHSITIKYSYEAEKYETFKTRSKADRYLAALLRKDTYLMYDDYSKEDFDKIGIDDEKLVLYYMNNRTAVPKELQLKLIEVRRKRELSEYVESNNYYRMLNGLPDVDDTDFVYLSKEMCERYGIPEDMPIHEISDKMGSVYINLLEGIGYVDTLIKEHPEKKYLKHVGFRRISIQRSRTAKNFTILKVEQESVMESTYREFVRSYEKARIYFVSTCYITQYRNVIPYYDNFIALCIFIMAIQQVSVRSIENAVDREFYDEYLVQLLYETYGLPYFDRIDKVTQKQIVQNLNLLIQNKATNKVLIDIASLLGFNDISIYQYYMIKKRKFDEHGRPIFAKKEKFDIATGETKIVDDDEAMHSVYFQKVDIREENIMDSLTDSLNRVEYHDLTFYDPFWWEDEQLHEEVWKTKYNFVETKYMGLTVPYRLTELLFQSVIMMRIIMEKHQDLTDVRIQLPKIIGGDISLPEAVILFFALTSKKYKISGQILTLPSKLIHVLEITDQEINKENDHIEVFGFDFEAFQGENLQKTIDILKDELQRREYRVVDGHDVDLRPDGRQDPFAPTHKIQYTINSDDLDQLYKYLTVLAIPDGSPKMKIEALNKMYENIEALYFFLSYRMSVTTDMNEYYAIKKFYDAAFYCKETSLMFEVTDEFGDVRPATTFLEYLKYKNKDLYYFVKNVEDDQIYVYINHIIYKMEEMLDHVGNLYLINDGFSPLMEILQILVLFFKSYIIDLAQLSSLMLIDWDLENTFRLFAEIDHISKVNQVPENLGKDFMDVIHRFICRFHLEDAFGLEDYYRICATLHLKEDQVLSMKETIKALKVLETTTFFDVDDTISKIRASIDLPDDQMRFHDVCVKIN